MAKLATDFILLRTPPNLWFLMKNHPSTLLLTLQFYRINNRRLAWNNILKNTFWVENWNVAICMVFWDFQGVENWKVPSNWVKWKDLSLKYIKIVLCLHTPPNSTTAKPPRIMHYLDWCHPLMISVENKDLPARYDLPFTIRNSRAVLASVFSWLFYEISRNGYLVEPTVGYIILYGIHIQDRVILDNCQRILKLYFQKIKKLGWKDTNN